ncbi:hypothetical protein [Rhodococcus opacus]|uniref:hypothetical protein n=1 Tax=Rhodococcus opacus TaxID=37919 RepID=UPI0006BB4956|nr:hypothetical protein [Rhodococcus opacus]
MNHEDKGGAAMYDLPMTNLPAALAQIDKANARLARNNIADRFTYVLDPYAREETNALGITTAQQRVRLNLSAPRIGFDGWVFVARLVEEEAGYVTFCAPGQNLDGWTRPDTPHCDYCGKLRRRAKLYVLRHSDTGEIKQVGASCITLFLGVKVAGLWTLEYDLDEHLPALGGEEWGEPATRGDRSLHKLDTIALALAFSNGGRGYISRARARDREIPATADTIATAVWGLQFIRNSEVRRELEDGVTEARRIRADQPELIDAVLASASTVDAASDYGMNLRTLLAGDYVSAKSVGIAASLVAVYARQQQLQAERATLVPGFVAPKGAKVTDLDATVTVSRIIDGHYGAKTLLVLRTEENQLVKWFATGLRDFEPGQRVRILRATVKDHETFRGQDQTVVTRAKLEDLEPAA